MVLEWRSDRTFPHFLKVSAGTYVVSIIFRIFSEKVLYNLSCYLQTFSHADTVFNREYLIFRKIP